MFTFDDFDAWGDAISGASLRLACDAVETPTWTLGMLDLGDVVLQMAFEGGGNLCYGGNTHAGAMLFVPLTHAHEHVVNGSPLDDDSLLVIPRGADFSIRVHRRAHAWCSIALPDGVVLPDAVVSGSTRVACRAGSVRALRRVVNGIGDALFEQPAGTAAHRTAGRALLKAAVSCLSAPTPQPVALGRPRLDRAAIVRRAMEAIEAIEDASTRPLAADIARCAGVNERTLLRTFRDTFGLPPKKYLMLRELHVIRRILRAGAPGHAAVADVLARHGIWEFGRFAGHYRRHFGELPSQTLQRARA